MFKSYRVGTLFGIPFRLDITFLVILPVFAWLLGGQIGDVVTVLNDGFGTDIDAGPLTSGRTPWLLGFAAAVALFTCVTLHELGHSVVAMAQGYEVESITLWLLGGIAKPAELPRNWLHEFWIAVAGPAVNIVIAAGCGVVVAVLTPGDAVLFLLLYLAVLNVALAVFNMLPAFPLDGGRVLRALLARRRTYVRATRQAAAIGKGFAVLLGIFGLLALNPVLVGIALFVYIAATSETRQMLLDAAFEGVSIAEVMTPARDLATVSSDTTISALLDLMLSSRHLGYPVVEDDEFVGIVTLEDVQSTDRTEGVVSSVMTPRSQLATVAPSTEVMDAFELLGNNEVGRLPVVDENDRLCGIVTRTDLMRSFRIVTQQQRFDREDLAAAEAIRQSRESRREGPG
jgi:Zn-dependent protease/predicted transcriptional regulator